MAEPRQPDQPDVIAEQTDSATADFVGTNRRGTALRNTLVAVALAFGVGGTLLCQTAPEPEQRAAAGEAVAIPAVATQRLRSVAVRSLAEISGVVEAKRSVQLFAETRGRLLALGARELDHVEADQLLAEIDPLLAEVAVERADASITRRLSELALAVANLERRTLLSDRGVASESALEDAINIERVATAALRESRADLRRARDDLSKKTIRAPFAGVLHRFSIEAGEVVHDGQQIGELLDLQRVVVRVGLSDREVVAVRAGQSVRLTLEAYPVEIFQGEIARVGSASDPDTRKFPVEIELDNSDGRLLPGMITRVSFYLGEAVTMLLIPRDATLEEFGLRFVYVLSPAEETAHLVAHRRRVTLRPLPFRPSEFEVLSGLSDGDEIAITGIGTLRDGEPVRRSGGSA